MFLMINDVAGMAAMAVVILVVVLGGVYWAFFKEKGSSDERGSSRPRRQ